MSVTTTVDVLDLLTIRECIEILVDRRTGRDPIPPLPPRVAEHVGTTHLRPRCWIDEAKDRLHQALIGGEVGLYASRKVRGGENVTFDAFIRIPSEKLAQSTALAIALPGDIMQARARDSLASFNGHEIRIRKSELEAWRRRHRKLLDKTKARRKPPRRPKPGRPDQERGLAINAIRELYPLGLPAGKPHRAIARQVVAEVKSRYEASISLRTAQRAVDWVSKRRSARN
jgi:hypothetical protein